MGAAGEPFLHRTLRPLHTVFRRIGGLHLSEIGGVEGLNETIDRHVTLLEKVLARDVDEAITASEQLINFADKVFDGLEAKIDPVLLNSVAAGYSHL